MISSHFDSRQATLNLNTHLPVRTQQTQAANILPLNITTILELSSFLEDRVNPNFHLHHQI